MRDKGMREFECTIIHHTSRSGTQSLISALSRFVPAPDIRLFGPQTAVMQPHLVADFFKQRGLAHDRLRAMDGFPSYAIFT
jgi:hypothetical protein